MVYWFGWWDYSMFDYKRNLYAKKKLAKILKWHEHSFCFKHFFFHFDYNWSFFTTFSLNYLYIYTRSIMQHLLNWNYFIRFYFAYKGFWVFHGLQFSSVQVVGNNKKRRVEFIDEAICTSMINL
jgi:hypothetical protein